MKVIEIMTTNVSTAEPDTTLEEIATIMRNEDIGAVPVIEGHELLGIITDRDIVVRCIAEGEHPSEMCADDILTDDLETVSPNSDVDEAAVIMGRRQIRRLPVVENGRLVGMVSLGDIAVKQRDEEVSGEALERVSRGIRGTTAGTKTAHGKAKPQSVGIPSRATGARGKHDEERRKSRIVPFRAEAKKKRHKAS